MVVKSPSLQSVKRGLFPSIHKPLPLTNRESQQLLDSITTSFRKNLDTEHPWQNNKSQHDTESFRGRKTSPAANKAPAEPHHVAERHLRAVLSNPLFSHHLDKKVAVESNITNHFNIFDSAVAKGLMTPSRAAGFLVAVRKQIATSDKESLDVKSTGAALRVVQWLRASGQENELHFLSNDGFVNNLMPFLYDEGLEEIAWNWLGRQQRLDERSAAFESGNIKSKPLVKLLASMVQISLNQSRTQGANLDTSYSALIRAKDMLSAEDQLSLYTILYAWTNVAWSSMAHGPDNFRPKASVPLFETFVDIGRPHKRLEVAHLELLHPTTPSHDAAERYLGALFRRLVRHSVDDYARESGHETGRRYELRRSISLARDVISHLNMLGDKTGTSLAQMFLDTYGRSIEERQPGNLSLA